MWNFHWILTHRRDSYDRYCIRIEEMRQSVWTIVQCLNQMHQIKLSMDRVP